MRNDPDNEARADDGNGRAVGTRLRRYSSARTRRDSDPRSRLRSVPFRRPYRRWRLGPPGASAAIPGHEVVGEVVALGEGVTVPAIGETVGVAWNGGACGHCRACLEGEETICPEREGTGYSRDGGYADHIVARADFVV